MNNTTTFFQRDDIVTIKLATGEELIVKMYDVGESKLFFYKPYIIEIQPQGYMLFPYVMTAKEGELLSLDTKNIYISCLTADDVAKAYLEKTTGLRLI